MQQRMQLLKLKLSLATAGTMQTFLNMLHFKPCETFYDINTQQFLLSLFIAMTTVMLQLLICRFTWVAGCNNDMVTSDSGHRLILQ